MIDLNKEREVFDEEFGVADFNMFASNDENLEQSMVLKCNWLGWKACAEHKQTEIDELKAKLNRSEDELRSSESILFRRIDELEAKLAKVESGEWVIVPKNANAFMYRVFCDARDEVPIIHTPQEAFQVGYKAMIEAAQENEDE